MNVNEMAGHILRVYKGLDEWPASTMPEHMLELVDRINTANGSYIAMRKYGFGLIHDTCAINPSDCKYYDKCKIDGKEQGVACEPEGLAFRLADILMYTMAVMAELGIDVDAVVTAQYRYLEHWAKEGQNED